MTRAGFFAILSTVALYGASGVHGQAQRPHAGQAGASGIARTPWGDPDLQGTYTNSNESGTPMERPPELAGRRLEDIDASELSTLIRERAERQRATAVTIGGTSENDTGAGPPHWYENYDAKNSRAWMVSDPADGKIPATTDEAKQRAAAVRAARRGGDGYYIGPFDGPEDLSLYVRCITRGVPGSMMPAIYGNTYDITQGPGFVAIRYEMVHETRVIPLDGRPHVAGSVTSYMGDARGRWEGDTLVVETTNILEKSAYNGASSRLRITERFRPVSRDAIEWSATFNDPSTWVRPWTFGMRLTRDDEHPVVEYACHEGNEGLRGILAAARAEEKSARTPK
ncbi:MAG TPA: hypothetical protein VFV95_20480 [Vicinamibacterales bacterium]|nr:hypothetical protein [Vicinamibacterales bacterium]